MTGLHSPLVLAQYTTGAYGSAINADALDNMTIGPQGIQASYRFMCNHTGTVSSVRFYIIWDATKSGYNAGTGGTLLVSLETDDGTSYHRPSGSILGSYSIVHPDVTFPLISLSPAPKLYAGTIYHLVFTNIDAYPTENYVSLDDLYMYHPLSEMQPLYSNTDCAMLIRDDWDSWYVFDYNTPIFQVNFSDGAKIGMGYIEAWPEAPQVIGGTHAVREQFTVTGSTRYVVGAAVRVARTSGSAPLTVRLETSTGDLIQEGYISASSVPLSSSSSPKYVWATYKFGTTRTLYDGDSYHLVFEASSGTTYQVFPVRKGGYYGFADTTYFPVGYAQFKSGSYWVGWTQWGKTNRTDADLQFYFIP